METTDVGLAALSDGPRLLLNLRQSSEFVLCERDPGAAALDMVVVIVSSIGGGRLLALRLSSMFSDVNGPISEDRARREVLQ
jgi:hypothetical protein